MDRYILTTVQLMLIRVRPIRMMMNIILMRILFEDIDQ